MSEQTKRCNRCAKDLPLGQFTPYLKGKPQLRPECRSCKRDRHRQWRQANPDWNFKWRAAKQEREVRPRPARCEVCGGKAGDKRKRVLCYDHNHDTGDFRGWLCSLCNTALGTAGDNPRILQKLAHYLETHGSAPTRPLIA